MKVAMFSCDFSHINADRLQTFNYQSLFDVKPWQSLDLSVLEGLGVDFDLKTIAQKKFNILKYTNTDLSVIDTLALISVDNDEWQDTITANKVSTHWWESILDGDVKTNKSLYAVLSLILQSHAIGNTNHSTLAIKSLTKTLKNNKTLQWHDSDLKDFVYAVIENNPSVIAKKAFKARQTISEFLEKYRLPIDKKLNTHAQNEWLGLYLKTPEDNLKHYSTAIQKFLLGNEKVSAIKHATKRALMIFNHKYFSTDLKKLEQETHKFSDIHRWLKNLNRTPDFTLSLDNKHRQILRVWLGAGNYYELRKIVEHIANMNQETQGGKKSISLSRYEFWQGFQSYIVDYWLLVPMNKLNHYDSINSQNIKPMNYSDKYNEPVILLRFDDHYFIQPLVYKANEVDLIMTDDVKILDQSLSAHYFDSNILHTITPCLIHDHFYLWQPDMACTLKEHFNIVSSNPYHFNPLDAEKRKERLKNLNRWVVQAEERNREYGDIDQYLTFCDLLDGVKRYFLSYNHRLTRHES